MLIKYTGKYVKIYFIIKITYLYMYRIVIFIHVQKYLKL